MREQLSPLRASLLGLFVLVAVGLATAGVFLIGQHGGLFAETFTLRASFPHISGVQEGTRVRIQGIDAGVVARIDPPRVPGEQVVLQLQLNARFRGLVRRDALAQLATQGVIGERVVELTPGTPGSPAAADGDEIAAEVPVEVSELLAEAQQAGDELRELGKKLSGSLDSLEELGGKLGTTVDRIDALTARVERGEGSVGRFVMTDEAHQAALELMQSGERLITTLDETVTAARRVWPLRDYFMNQGMSNPDDMLYRPGAQRELRRFDSADLFRRGTSVLTSAGRTRLDQAASWLLANTQSQSEIVVAAFVQDEANNTKAQKLSQEQATAVRDYLVDEHGVNKLGIFSRRDVLPAGFGNLQPDGQADGLPSRRVEVILFTPAAK